MSKTVITQKEIEVPLGILLEVVEVLLENEINNTIVGTDEEEDCLQLEIIYRKDQREAIHEVEDLITDFEEEETDG